MVKGWHKGPVRWETRTRIYYSFVFSWDFYRWTITRKTEDKKIIIGGPAVLLNPQWVPEDCHTQSHCREVLSRHNPHATRTTSGCIRQCKFCAVPKIEGEFRELKSWLPGKFVIDNNLLAASYKHFVKVIDSLVALYGVDFNQGLDARLLRRKHVDQLCRLNNPLIRLAWDDINNENQFIRAFNNLRSGGINKKNIRVYVLIGYKDTPEDALYRLEKIRRLGIMPNPMRYQPLHSKKKNEYVAPSWTDRELKDYMRYWSNLRYLGKIPFKEYRYNYKRGEKN